MFLGLLVAVAVNALLYAAKAANPLIASDGWYFLDAIVRKAALGDLVPGDLFLKRGALDHSQPLRKLILLFHYRYFDLDYSVEAIIGVLAAFLDVGIMWLMVRPKHGLPDSDRPFLLIAFCAMVAIYLSLNSAVVFNWPLLTLAYTSHVFVLVFLWLAWIAFREPRPLRLFVVFASTFLMDVVADDTGLVATIAAAMAVALMGVRERRWLGGAKVIVAMVSAYLVYAAMFALVSTPVGSGNEPAGLSTGNLLAGLGNHFDDLLGAFAVPLVASIAHRMQLKAMLGPDTASAETMIVLVLAAAHAWFWWRAMRGRINLPAFVATALMLLFYGLFAGMLIARVSMHGVDYLWQPRYVLIFEWNVVALLLMAIAQYCLADDTGTLPRNRGDRVGRAVLACACALLLLLQLPLSYNTWAGLKFVSVYQQRMAAQLGAVAAHPDDMSLACGPMLKVCNYKPERRAEVMHFLEERRLNIFSPAFRARNRLYPDAQSLPH